MSSLLLEAFCLRWDSQLWEPAAFFETFCQAILRGIRACAATKVNNTILRSISPGDPARHPSLRRDQGKQFYADLGIETFRLTATRPMQIVKMNLSSPVSANYFQGQPCEIFLQ
jgi:hypothetical protein